jgi:hypothetical protein
MRRQARQARRKANEDESWSLVTDFRLGIKPSDVLLFRGAVILADQEVGSGSLELRGDAHAEVHLAPHLQPVGLAHVPIQIYTLTIDLHSNLPPEETTILSAGGFGMLTLHSDGSLGFGETPAQTPAQPGAQELQEGRVLPNRWHRVMLTVTTLPGAGLVQAYIDGVPSVRAPLEKDALTAWRLDPKRPVVLGSGGEAVPATGASSGDGHSVLRLRLFELLPNNCLDEDSVKSRQALRRNFVVGRDDRELETLAGALVLTEALGEDAVPLWSTGGFQGEFCDPWSAQCPDCVDAIRVLTLGMKLVLDPTPGTLLHELHGLIVRGRAGAFKTLEEATNALIEASELWRAWQEFVDEEGKAEAVQPL